jgi:adenosylhomocysteine nucleosidase
MSVLESSFPAATGGESMNNQMDPLPKTAGDDLRMAGIVAATRFEASPVIRALGFRREAPDLYRYPQNGRSALLMISGIGLEAARQAAYRLCDAGAKELVSIGYCGALSPGLQVGDLIVDRIASSRTAVWKRADRLALAEKAGAQAVDMETQAIVEAGTRRGVPIKVLRVVSDRLDDDVSPLLGQEASFSPVRIALRLWNPRMWPYLYKLWRQSRTASARLVQAVASYLENPAS